MKKLIKLNDCVFDAMKVYAVDRARTYIDKGKKTIWYTRISLVDSNAGLFTVRTDSTVQEVMEAIDKEIK